MEPYGFIYKITNKVNGKTYIGQTKNGFDIRYMYNIENTSNKLLKSDIEKYGIESFEIIKKFDKACTAEELDELEIAYIQRFHSLETEHGYNRMTGGKNGRPTEQLREELSEAHKGYVMPEAQKKKISEALSGEKSPYYGIHHSEDRKKKISNSLKLYYAKHDSPQKGKKLPEERIEKLRRYRIGMKQPAEAVKKTADALRGVPKSEEHKKRISEARKGMMFSEEHRKHISEAKKGKHLTDEHKSKIAESLKGRKTSDLQKIKSKEASSKKVKCIETGIVYASGTDAAKSTGLTSGAIYRACKKDTNTAAGKHWKYVI